MWVSGKIYSAQDYIAAGLCSAAVGGFLSFVFGKLTTGVAFFDDTEFFMTNFVKFATDYGGITLKNVVIFQLTGQLAAYYTVIGVLEGFFEFIVECITNRLKGLDRKEAWEYAIQ